MLKIKHDYLRLILSKLGLRLMEELAKDVKIKHGFQQLILSKLRLRISGRIS